MYTKIYIKNIDTNLKKKKKKPSDLYGDVVRPVGQVKLFGQSAVGPVVGVVDGGVGVNEPGHVCPAHRGAH